MSRILVTGAFKYSESQKRKINHLGFKIIDFDDETQIVDFNVSDIEFVICNSLFMYNDIRNFVSLKYIHLTSAGLDRVPLEYINKHGIKLCNAKNIYSVPIAEMVILKILEIFKKTRLYYNQQKNNVWSKNKNLISLKGKKVAIFGFGNIGKEIARKLYAFDARITAVDVKEIFSPYTHESLLIDQLIGRALKFDIIISALPLNSQTTNYFDKGFFERLISGCIFVNISRGKVVNQKDLIDALETKKIQAAVLDVFIEEPLERGNPLWDYENVYITPHISYASDLNSKELFKLIYNQLREWRESNV